MKARATSKPLNFFFLKVKKLRLWAHGLPRKSPGCGRLILGHILSSYLKTYGHKAQETFQSKQLAASHRYGFATALSAGSGAENSFKMAMATCALSMQLLTQRRMVRSSTASTCSVAVNPSTLMCRETLQKAGEGKMLL